MKKLRIYIDFADVPDFAQKLKGRIKNIDGIGKVEEYNDLRPKDSVINFDWEDITSKAIKKADIVIPILTAHYLSYLTENIESLFNDIIDSKSKFLFPIFYEDSEWSSYKWIVRSNLIPNDGEALSNKDKKKSDELINDLIKTIKDIIIKFSTDSKSQNKDEVNNKSIEDNIIFISHDHDDADFR